MIKVYNNIKTISYAEFDGVLKAFEDAYMSILQDIKDESTNKLPWNKLIDNYYIGNHNCFVDYFLWFQKKSEFNNSFQTYSTIKTHTTRINGKEYNIEFVFKLPLTTTDDNGLLSESVEFMLKLDDNGITYICDVEPSVEIDEYNTCSITCMIYILVDCELLVLNSYLNGTGHINYDFTNNHSKYWYILAEKENFIQIVHKYYDEDEFNKVISIDNIEQLAYTP